MGWHSRGFVVGRYRSSRRRTIDLQYSAIISCVQPLYLDKTVNHIMKNRPDLFLGILSEVCTAVEEVRDE